MMKNIKRFFQTLLLGLLFVTLCLVVLFFFYNRPSAQLPQESVDFRIENGESSYAVASRLIEKGWIRSEIVFKLIARLDRNGGVKRGLYSVSQGDSTLHIYQIFKQGKQKMVQVTIPEGLTLSAVADVIAASGLSSRVDFLQAVNDYSNSKIISSQALSLEGYLFPDTYTVPAELDASLLVKTMVDQFTITIESLLSMSNNNSLSVEQIYDYLILASVVEKEYKLASEAPIIASVFKNRLEQGMRLESCATVVYVITEILGKPHPSRLFYNDLKIDSTYNSYRYRGLPPAPICSPGRDALNAVFYPSESDYLYFVVDDPVTGKHSFSSDYSQHNQKKDEYVQQYLN